MGRAGQQIAPRHGVSSRVVACRHGESVSNPGGSRRRWRACRLTAASSEKCARAQAISLTLADSLSRTDLRSLWDGRSVRATSLDALLWRSSRASYRSVRQLSANRGSRRSGPSRVSLGGIYGVAGIHVSFFSRTIGERDQQKYDAHAHAKTDESEAVEPGNVAPRPSGNTDRAQPNDVRTEEGSGSV